MADPKDQPAKPPRSDKEKKRLDKLLDAALDDTFPASDALSITQPAPEPPSEK